MGAPAQVNRQYIIHSISRRPFYVPESDFAVADSALPIRHSVDGRRVYPNRPSTASNTARLSRRKEGRGAPTARKVDDRSAIRLRNGMICHTGVDPHAPVPPKRPSRQRQPRIRHPPVHTNTWCANGTVNREWDPPMQWAYLTREAPMYPYPQTARTSADLYEFFKPTFKTGAPAVFANTKNSQG